MVAQLTAGGRRLAESGSRTSLQFRACRARFNLPRLPCWGMGCITINRLINATYIQHSTRLRDSLAPAPSPIQAGGGTKARRACMLCGALMHACMEPPSIHVFIGAGD
jgi:hypothetical protein